MENGRRLSPWIWVPTLYFAEGVPYAIVTDTSKLMYTDLGLTPEKMALVTGSMYLSWVVKPLWSPLIDLAKTKRWWIVVTELLLAAALLGLAVAIKSPAWLFWTQVCFWVLAATSATQDISADGFYMLALNEKDQAGFTGIRSTAYKLSNLIAKGALVWIAGALTVSHGKFDGWSLMVTIPGVLFLLLGIYHFFVLPKPDIDQPREVPSVPQFVRGYLATFLTFFKKPGVGQAIAFILLFRLAEGQVLAMVAPFLKGPLDQGGLALSTQQVGVTYGTFGMFGIIIGGITAGWLVSRYGVKKWYWPMIFIMHLPNLAFLYLAFSQNNAITAVSTCLFIEQFGYGFGFTVFMLYLMYFTRGELQTSHYAIATGFMAAGVMLPQMATGYIQQALGFKGFFGYIALCTLPSFAVAWMAWKDEGFLHYFEPKSVEVTDDVGITPE